MATLIHADIFFFIASIATIVLAVLFAVALFYIVLILRDLRYLSGIAKRESEKLAGDFDEFREAVKGERTRIKSIFDFFLDLFIRRAKQKLGGKKKADK